MSAISWNVRPGSFFIAADQGEAVTLVIQERGDHPQYRAKVHRLPLSGESIPASPAGMPEQRQGGPG